MKRSNNRLRFLYIVMLTFAMIVIVNVFFVTVGHIHIRSNTSLDDYVNSVSNVEETIFASRGIIYSGDNMVIAQDVKTYDIICYLDKNRLSNGNNVAYVDDPSFTAKALAPILGMEEIDIYDMLTSSPGLYQTELGSKGRNLSEEQVKQIKAIEGLHGIDFRNSYMRYYPLGDSYASYIVGFAQSDDTGKLIGKMGVESYYNEELSGVDGYHTYQQDKNGYVLPGMYEYTEPAKNGYDIYLTIDTAIQDALNSCLMKTIESKNASRAWGAVVEIKSGKILAWGQCPSFDPNVLDIEDYNNYGAQLAYEPGSVMKSVIYAAAMDLGVYDGEAIFDSSPYCYTDDTTRTYSGDQLGCIYNVSKLDWGNIPLDYGLIYSSNVATATLLSKYVGISNYKNYLDRFHLYQKVNTDSLSEIPGYTNYGLSPVDDITATYGQGSSLTMLQLLQAYTAIFGNGEMVKPYYIDRIVDPNTNTAIYQGTRKVVSTPISEDTARNMQALLRRVVSDPEGTCRHYEANSVSVMGKTGTSEIPVDGGYSENEDIISCMLGFPAEDPQYMLYYAYISAENVYYNYDIKPVPELIDRIALLEGLALGESEDTQAGSITKYEMPNVLNMSYDKAYEVLANNDYDIIRINDGSKVIKQYPEALDETYTGEKVFILCDGSSISLPDFEGWTRKEIISYWSTSGLPITIEGYGVAYEQSPSPDTIVGDQEIIVKMREINHQEKPEEVLQENEE